jgi:hypothetical protein
LIALMRIGGGMDVIGGNALKARLRRFGGDDTADYSDLGQGGVTFTLGAQVGSVTLDNKPDRRAYTVTHTATGETDVVIEVEHIIGSNQADLLDLKAGKSFEELHDAVKQIDFGGQQGALLNIAANDNAPLRTYAGAG